MGVLDTLWVILKDREIKSLLGTSQRTGQSQLHWKPTIVDHYSVFCTAHRIGHMITDKDV